MDAAPYATQGKLIPKEHCEHLGSGQLGLQCKWSDADQWCHNCVYGGGVVCAGRNHQQPCTRLNVNSSGP